MTRQIRYALILSIISLILFGCMPPQYSLDFKNVNFTHISLDKISLEPKIQMSYKLFRPVTISDINYTFFVNDHKIGEGAYPGKIKLGKKADTLLVFPFDIEYKDVTASLIRDAILKEKFNYEVLVDFKVTNSFWPGKKHHLKYEGIKE